MGEVWGKGNFAFFLGFLTIFRLSALSVSSFLSFYFFIFSSEFEKCQKQETSHSSLGYEYKNIFHEQN